MFDLYGQTSTLSQKFYQKLNKMCDKIYTL